MARVNDLWTSERVVRDEAGNAILGPNGRAVKKKVKTSRHPDNGGNRKAKRWQAVWRDASGGEKTKTFLRYSDAEQYGIEMESEALALCLVPRCQRHSATEPPVLLCEDHRDLAVAQATKRRPHVHEPLVYFVRNGSRIKIGWTTNIKGRMTALALPMSAVELTIPGGPAEEDMMHSRFHASRISRTEWFESTEELEDFIRQTCAEQEQGSAALIHPACSGLTTG